MITFLRSGVDRVMSTLECFNCVTVDAENAKLRSKYERLRAAVDQLMFATHSLQANGFLYREELAYLRKKLADLFETRFGKESDEHT